MPEILGMSIAMAAIVAAVGGIAARTIVGWLKSDGTFNIRHAAASGGVAVIIGIPLIITTFSAAFQSVESLTQEAQLSLFMIIFTKVTRIDHGKSRASIAAPVLIQA